MVPEVLLHTKTYEKTTTVALLLSSLSLAVLISSRWRSASWSSWQAILGAIWSFRGCGRPTHSRRSPEHEDEMSAELITHDVEDLLGEEARPELLGTGEVKRRKRQQNDQESNEEDADLRQGHLPGRQRVYVQTHGCQHNQSDGEYMMGQLQEYGYTLVDSIAECDVCVVNSCTVKTPSEARGLSIVSEAKGAGKRVVLAGCVPSGDRSLADKLKDVSMLHVSQLDRIVDVVEEAVKGHTVTLLDRRSDLPSLALPRVRKDRLAETITINAGCLGSCTYCKTKLARGQVVSYPIEEIVARAKLAAEEGVRYIELASEDMGAYGVDIGTNIAELLLRLSDSLPPGVMLRTGMTNPPYMLQHIDGIIEALQRPNVFTFMHIPVQSGSDAVLHSMRREYTVAQFSHLVDRLQAAMPEIYILTDIICGFPAESEEDWQATMALVKKYRFPAIYSSRFFARTGTPAMKMKQLNPKVIKARYQELVEFTQSLSEKNSQLQGREERVWFTSTEPTRGQTVGRTKGYVKVVVERDDLLLGRSALVKIERTSVKHAEGRVVGGLL
mmetsp:Transcript_2227/g.3815  ORF Transcript_2227/g.3815 Transcript_2227/m.3815 type:complete len:556 (-) Transcript_2227:7-1674(-)